MFIKIIRILFSALRGVTLGESLDPPSTRLPLKDDREEGLNISVICLISHELRQIYLPICC